MMRRICFGMLFLGAVAAAQKPVPGPGIEVPAAERAALESGLKRLGAAVEALKQKQGLRSPLVADVAVFHKAVRHALTYDEFLKPEEIAVAKELLRQGQDRADFLAAGQAPWAVQSGLVVRGYFSRIDGSVQPYGLFVPSSWSPGSPHRWRLDVWFHGRNDNLTELNFLQDRLNNPGQFTPPDTIVLHPYGRYSNANKFAGEVDLFEALETVKRQYRIDEDRILVRGFSMGGAAVWHLAAHHAGLWAAAAPGAGFAETGEYLGIVRPPGSEARTPAEPEPAWWERKLWRWYDATAYALNLWNVPVVAYSGEKDRQIQAARVMEREMAKEGLALKHIIGPGTEHRYHPESRLLIEEHMSRIAARGREAQPRKVRFVTHTLRYNRMRWVRVDGLAEHWEPARVEAEIQGERRVAVTTSGVTAFTLDFEPGSCPLDPMAKPAVTIDGVTVAPPPPLSDRSWTISFARAGAGWRLATARDRGGLRKQHGLQGPIDDAFLDSFIVVRPTGTPAPGRAGAWVNAEMERAIREWRKVFRGEPQVKNDSEITEQDSGSANLVLWGDPRSNRYLARIANRLPLTWSDSEIVMGGERFPAADHAPVLIYPNPLNTSRYVVVNSGFTFREDAYRSNARQVAVLPDWAIIDVSSPPNSRWPGRVAAAGFFGERWEAPGPARGPVAPAKPEAAPSKPEPAVEAIPRLSQPPAAEVKAEPRVAPKKARPKKATKTGAP